MKHRIMSLCLCCMLWALTITAPPVFAEDAELEPAITAGAGDAYLTVVDSYWWIQYWGDAENDGYMLSYNAGVPHISGNGSYTVSVTADTNGFRLATTEDVNEQYRPTGIFHLGVYIRDGRIETPGAVITIDRVLVDGQEIPLQNKGFTYYTYTEYGEPYNDLQTLIYEGFDPLANALPHPTAYSSEGALYDENGALKDWAYDYSVRRFDKQYTGEWMTIAVDFTISGLPYDKEEPTESSHPDGDVNADGAVSLLDAVLLQKYLVRMSDLSMAQCLSADLDGSGAVDVFDLARLKNIILNG